VVDEWQMNRRFRLCSRRVLKNSHQPALCWALFTQPEVFTMHAHQILSLSTARRWAAASLLAGLSMGAIAQSAPTAPAAATAATAATAPQAASKVQQPSLNIRQIYDRLDAAGYRELQEIEWSDGRYEVKGMNAQGERVKLEVDGNTGEVLRSRTKR
jgi:hypothetical protein